MIDLKEERVKNGITQEQLGREIGVTRQTISEIERGVNRPSVETAQAIAKMLGFDWTRFFPSS